MSRKTFATFGVLVILLVSIYTIAGAQGTIPTDTTPVPEVQASASPTATTTVAGAKYFTHPVVKLLGAYFDKQLAGKLPTPTSTETSATPDPSATADPSETPDPSASPTPEPTDTAVSESGLGPIGEQIAAYHEAGMGFGVLVKIYSMVEASVVACEKAGTEGTTGEVSTTGAVAGVECPIYTPDELVTAFQGGMGMGNLFKEYGGKPAMLGVGHVKKEMGKMGDDEPVVVVTPTDTPTETPTEAVTGTETETQSEILTQPKGNKPAIKVKPEKGTTIKSKGPKK